MIHFSPEFLRLPRRPCVGTLSGAVVAVLIPVLIAGCGGGAMSVQEAFETPAQVESRCTLSSGERVPTVDEAVDGDAVARWIESRPASEGEAEDGSPAVVLSIQRDSSTWVQLLASDLDEVAAEELRTEVQRSLPEMDEDRPALVYRLRIEVGPEPRFDVAPSISCAPTIANRDRVFEQLSEIPREVTARGGGQAVVLFRVAADGSSEVYELEQSTGNPELDRAIMRIARTARFHPGQIDGVGLQTYSRVPFHVGSGR